MSVVGTLIEFIKPKVNLYEFVGAPIKHQSINTLV